MPTFRQRFTGNIEEDFPVPPIARRLQPGDVVEYEADEPISHARLELVEGEGPVHEKPPDDHPAAEEAASSTEE